MEVVKKEIIIPRTLLDKDNKEKDAYVEFEDLYKEVFCKFDVEKATIINISTTYNDYKKLYDDLKKKTEKWQEKSKSISPRNSIDDLLEIGKLRKFCCKKKKIRNSKAVLALKMAEAILAFLTIFQIVFNLLIGKELLNSSGVLILAILGIGVLYFTIVLFNKKQNEESIRIIEELETEAEIIDFFQEMGFEGCKIYEEGIFLIENLSKLDKLCRCYILAYLYNTNTKKQLWCIFDYLFETTEKVESVNKTAKFVNYRLQPLKYSEKEKLYKEYSLHNNICKEYLNCIGVDILWAENFEIGNSNYKLHSLNYIQNKLKGIEDKNKYGKSLMGFFYCILYINIKYQYYFSIEEMARLYRKTDDAVLKKIIEKNTYKIGNMDELDEEEIKLFFKQIVSTLEGYYVTEEVRRKSRKTKKYKFSYDVFECFQKKRENEYLSEDDIKLWILLKVITEKDIFCADRYFFDCSNLLVTNESLENEEYLLLANKILKILNNNNCLFYYLPILRQIKEILEEGREADREILDREILEKAIVNELFYSSSNESMEIAIGYLQENVDRNKILYDFWNGDVVKQEEIHQNVKEFYEMLYFVMNKLVYSELELLKFDDVECGEGENDLYNIYINLLWIVVYDYKKEEVEKKIQELYKRVKKYAKGEATKIFEVVMIELLQWIKSEINGEEDCKYRNVNVGVLIEMTGSNMLFFIYGLLNMSIIRNKDNVYRNENSLLDFISRCFFYVVIMPMQKGARTFGDELICSEMPTEIKLSILIELLARGMMWVDNACKFIVSNTESMLKLIKQHFKIIEEVSQLEQFFALLDIYTNCIDEQKFSNAVYKEIEMNLENSDYESKELYIREAKVILRGEKFEMTIEDMIFEINNVESTSFGAILLEAYCKIKPELLERLESIKKEILCDSYSNTGMNLMQKYLLQHEYYDCNKKIFEYYLEKIKTRRYLKRGNVRGYLYIIDRFRKDNESIMEKEMFTYNYMISLDLYYRAVELYEEQEKNDIYKKKTLEFFKIMISSLRELGIQYYFSNQYILYYLKNMKYERDNEIEQIIFDKFERLSPIIEKNNELYLSGEYMFMLQYMQEHNDIYARLAICQKEKGKEVLQKKHLYQLTNLLIQLTEEKSIGFLKESLSNIRDIVYAMCNV